MLANEKEVLRFIKDVYKNTKKIEISFDDRIICLFYFSDIEDSNNYLKAVKYSKFLEEEHDDNIYYHYNFDYNGPGWYIFSEIKKTEKNKMHYFIKCNKCTFNTNF